MIVPIIVRWRRWEPSVVHEIDSPDKALVKAINEALDSMYAREKFVNLWKYWWQTFPNACVLATLTQSGWDKEDLKQFRLWFGEPAYIRPDHVDSSGHNLIADIVARPHDIMQLVELLFSGSKFEKDFQEVSNWPNTLGNRYVVTWRRIPTSR